jgi:hypothetical protein
MSLADGRFWHIASFRCDAKSVIFIGVVHARIDAGGLGGKIVLLPWPASATNHVQPS